VLKATAFWSVSELNSMNTSSNFCIKIYIESYDLAAIVSSSSSPNLADNGQMIAAQT